ncbi:DUF6221 family protein [Streptomyces sp. NPDC008240]|uniref:DUF6221 family protein n=1 Tax=Streptomyces sp. NPDC008240 TaxID=3364822 RepID=UPI0036ED5B9C
MDELVRWLTACLDEDEQIARAATPGPWTVDSATYAERIDSPDGPVIAGGRWGGEASVFESTEDALHIAAHDPARVLREIDPDRQLLAMYAEVAANDLNDVEYAHGWANALGLAVRLRASAFSDRPGYREEWRP